MSLEKSLSSLRIRWASNPKKTKSVPDLHRLYAPLATPQDREIALPDEEAHHALRVLRMVGGEEVEVFNGKGLLVRGRIQPSSGKRAVVVVTQGEQLPLESKPQLTLYLAPTKGSDRLEWMLEKAVELGLQKIQFIETERTERGKLRMDRLEKVAIAALKQSKQLVLPQLWPMIGMKEALENHTGQGYLGWLPQTETPELLWKTWDVQNSVSVWIGPEGDFTASEVQNAIAAGITPVHLGNARLRTETAALLVVAAYLTSGK
jgi:16S rRNA (uracil1498-N3)-methyltransferase